MLASSLAVSGGIFAADGFALRSQVISPTAHHLDGTLEYNVHNLYGHTSARATAHALSNIYPDRRPFVLTRCSNTSCLCMPVCT